MSNKAFSFFSALLLVCGISIFAYNSLQNTTSKTEPSVQYWSQEGDFIYSGALNSSLSGSENFFGENRSIEEIKTFHSAENNIFSYIEYPNFSEIPNTVILKSLRESLQKIGHRAQLLASQTGASVFFDTDFSLANGNNIGSVIYTINRRDADGIKQESAKKIFLISSQWQFVAQKDLLNSENFDKKQHLKTVIIQNFSTQFPQKKLWENARVQQNLDAYLEEPDFAFSGSVVDFYIYSGLLSEENPENVIISIDYNSLENAILLAPKQPEIPKSSAKSEQKSAKDGKKYVALTFDDGPHRTFTPQLLDTLKEKNVHATFFMLGQNAEKNPEIVKRVFDEWHDVESHSWDHPAFTKLSKIEVKNQIQKTQDAIKNIIGVAPTQFRPPYGAYNPQIVKNVGLTFVLWSVDSYDWKNRNVAKNLKIVNSTVHDGAIILFHDIHKESVETIPTLIDDLRAKWYEFLTVAELHEKYYHNAFLPEQICFSMSRCQ